MTTPIREWARANGYVVADRGRLSPAIHTAYRTAFGDTTPERPYGAAQCQVCGRFWTAAREAHCTVCHRHFSAVRYFDEHTRYTENRNPVKRGVWRCVDPLTIQSRNGEVKYRLVDSAWGKLIASTSERPEDSYGEGVLL